MSINLEEPTLFLKRRPRRPRSTANLLFGSSSRIPMEDTSDEGSSRMRNYRWGEEPQLDLSGSDTSQSSRRSEDGSSGLLDSSSRCRSFHSLRRRDQQLFLARQSTLPHHIPISFHSNDQDGPRKSLHSVVEQPHAEADEAVEEDTPTKLVFRRTKRASSRRMSAWD